MGPAPEKPDVCVAGMAGWSVVRSDSGKKRANGRLDNTGLGDLSKRVAKKGLIRWNDIYGMQMPPVDDSGDD